MPVYTTDLSRAILHTTKEAEEHVHSWESWFEDASVPTATHKADRLGDGAGAFQLDAGNDDWGAWVQILGSDDTPARTGMLKFDAHRLLVEDTERTETYFIQIAEGASGAAALAAETYSEVPYTPASSRDAGPLDINMKRRDAATLVWARCKCPGQNTATIDLYLGIHEYDFDYI